MRLLADSNIVSRAVHSLREKGHDLIYAGERESDPGDLAILNEARASNRVLLTKDHDIGALVFKERVVHAGVLLIDDLGSAPGETELLSDLLGTWQAQLEAGAFVRGGVWGSRVVHKDQQQ